MTAHRNSKAIRRTFYVVLWLLLAAILAALAASSMHVSSSGRDFRPHGVALSLILLASGSFFRYIANWPWSSLIAGLVIVECLTLFIIGYFSGSLGTDLFSPFNLRWLSAVNLFLGLPWLCGAGLGEALIRYKAGRARG